MGPGSPTDATAPRDLGPDSDEAALRWTFEVAETGRRAGRSPGTVKNKLHLIDQNDAIYRVNGNKNVQKVFDIDQAPDGLALDNRQAVLNIAPGPSQNTMYVAFTSRSEAHHRHTDLQDARPAGWRVLQRGAPTTHPPCRVRALPRTKGREFRAGGSSWTAK
jgi:hypothetical protein